MTTFAVWWDPRKQYHLSTSLSLPTGGGTGVQVGPGDLLYVISLGDEPRILARLDVVDARLEGEFRRVTLNVRSHRTAFFAKNYNSAPSTPLRIVGLVAGVHVAGVHKETTVLREADAGRLKGYCEHNEDFSRLGLPLNWEGISRKVSRYVGRRPQTGDDRSDLEVAVEWLMSRYTTDELPGPAPVYLNAALKALGAVQAGVMDFGAMSGGAATTRSLGGTLASAPEASRPHRPREVIIRRSSPLTDAAIKAGINKNISEMSVYSPDSRKHQEILLRLRDRLLELGLEPEQDGLVDCKVRLDGRLVYFEVKSSAPGSLVKAMRCGVGQVQHYLWMDRGYGLPEIKGHLVLEDRVYRVGSIPEFVESVGLGFTWSNDLSGLTLDGLARSNTLLVPMAGGSLVSPAAL